MVLHLCIILGLNPSPTLESSRVTHLDFLKSNPWEDLSVEQNPIFWQLKIKVYSVILKLQWKNIPQLVFNSCYWRPCPRGISLRPETPPGVGRRHVVAMLVLVAILPFSFSTNSPSLTSLASFLPSGLKYHHLHFLLCLPSITSFIVVVSNQHIYTTD